MIGRRITVQYYCGEKIGSDSSFFFSPIYIFTVIAVTTVTAFIVFSAKAGARFVSHLYGLRFMTLFYNIKFICKPANKKLTEQTTQLRSLQRFVSLLAFLRRIEQKENDQ